jgi:DNA-binding transcriptional ArsR family regulator
MLEDLIGKTAQKILLHLFHYGETYASAVSKDLSTSLGQVQRSLDHLENAGLLISKRLGKTRVYSFNPKSAYTKTFRELVKIEYETIPLSEHTKIFSEKRRPRRRGKPVVRS